MCIILSLTENYYFIKISAHLHYVRKLLEFKVLWGCRCCADFRGCDMIQIYFTRFNKFNVYEKV